MLDIIIPTRGRPEYCADAIHSIRKTATGDYRINLGLDSDDPKLEEYEQILGVNQFVVKPTGGASEVCNRLLKYTAGEYIQFIADDNLCITDGWDEILVKAFPPDDIAVVYPNIMEDRIARKYYAPMFSRKWLDIVGWGLLPGVKHYAVDHGLFEMARALDRAIWVDDVVIAHRHFSRSPDGIPKDALYERNESNAVADTSKVRGAKDLYAEKVELLRKAMA